MKKKCGTASTNSAASGARSKCARSSIAVKDGKTQEVRIEYTHHGPIVAHRNGKAYSLALPYFDQFRLLESDWKLDTARNLEEAKQALAELQFMPQNIMIGTVDGDIYYVRNGRVPMPPRRLRSLQAHAGDAANANGRACTASRSWCRSPIRKQGYMQNCNVSPFAMMKNSPLVPEEWAAHPYIYNDVRRPPSQRAAMMVDLLDAARDVTPEQMMGIAFSPQVWHAELWQERIRKAAPEDELARLLAGWNRRSDADSRAALAYYLFKTALGPAGRDVGSAGFPDRRCRSAPHWTRPARA